MKLNKKNIIKTAIINGVSIAAASGLFIAGNIIAGSQNTQFAAERWVNGHKGLDYAQVSCFFGKDAYMSVETVNSVRSSILSELTNASISQKENSRIWYDSFYSRYGKVTASGSKIGTAECEMNVVNGDFFLLHDFELQSGSYFSENDIMQDAAVIDADLAWQLFGSYDVAGMSITLNNVPFYVSGVISTPETKAEKSGYGKTPQLYVSYDGASSIRGEKYTDISCYEAVLPQPVENFAYKTLKQSTEAFKDNAVLVENTNRFSVWKRIKAVKKIPSMVTVNKPIAYTWWENGAKITEFKLSFIYLGAMVCLVVPLITLIRLIVRLYKVIKSKKHKIIEGALKLVSKITKHKKGRKQ